MSHSEGRSRRRSSSRSPSRSPAERRDRRDRSPPRRSRSSPVRHAEGRRGNRNRSPSPDGNYQYGKLADAPAPDDPKKPVLEKEKPDFGLSGKLQQAPTKNGVALKWMEPPDAAKSSKKWRLYPFKGDEPLEPLPLYRKSCYIFGRDRSIADIPTDHPSCSKQHAVIQFRVIQQPQSDDSLDPAPRVIKPYIVDLGSTNGTFIKNRKTGEKDKIDDSRYYELRERDVLYFGFSSREYVLLHDDMIRDEDTRS